MRIYTYDEWKSLLKLDEKDHACPTCEGQGKSIHADCAGEGCRKCSPGTGCDNCDGDGCGNCGRGFLVCNVCKGAGHTLKLAYERSRKLEIERLRKWGVTL
jgi:hypothetical protein